MRYWLLVAAFALVALPSSASPAGSPTGEIAFLSTLPAWPPPENLDAARLYSAGVAGQPRRQLDAGGTVDGTAMASLSPDRRRIAVVRGSGPHGDSKGLWLVSTYGSGERRLLAEQPQESFLEEMSFLPPAWSPNGRLLAVNAVSTASCYPNAMKCATWAVVVVDMSGRRVVTIESARNASWAPDGKRLVVERGRDGGFSLTPEATTIDVVRLGSPKAGRTVSGRIPARGGCLLYPSWSPDGRTIAFDEGDCDTLELVLMHLVGAADGRRLRSGPGVLGDWSPDGSKLLFYGTTDAAPIYVVGRDGRGLCRLASRSSGSAAWSRNGSRVVFVGAGEGKPLFSVGADGRGLRRLVAATGGSFAVAPTRPLIAFTLRNGRDLGVVASTGGSARVVSRQPKPWRVSPLGWTSDGSRVLFEGWSATLPEPALWVMRADGSDGRLLADDAGFGPQGDGAPAWSPDGRWLAYRTASWGLKVVGRDGTGGRTLATAPVAGFSWAPDSARIAYVEGRPGSIKVVRRDGSGRQLVTRSEDVNTLAWSPAGDWIAYVTSGIRMVHPDGTGSRTLVPRTVDTVPGSPAWAPDGKQVAYTRAGGVDAVPLAGGPARTLMPPLPPPAPFGYRTACDTPAWAPDGTSLAAVCDGLRIIDADGSGSRLAAPVVAGAWPRLGSWSPDGRSIVYATGVGSTAVYVVGVDGGDPARITSFNARSTAPSWAPG